MKPACLALALLLPASSYAVSPTAVAVPAPQLLATPPAALKILDPHVPAAATGQSAAVSIMFVNPTSSTIVIRGATSPVAQLIRLQHITKTPEGLMQMTDLPRLEIPPKSNVVLAPGATELRLLNLAQPLAAGFETPLTLIYQNGATQTIRVHIKE